METGFEQRLEELTGAELLGLLGRVLDALAERTALSTDRDLLDLLQQSLRVAARLHAWQAGTAARIEAVEAAWREHGTSTSTWLADVANLTRREAARLVGHGQELDRFGVVGDAARSGAVLPEQAEAITGVLADLPDSLPSPVLEQAQDLMVGFAATYNSAELRRLTHRLVEVLSPDTAEELEAARVEREHRIATRTRHLTFAPDHHGSILLKGSLPVVDAESLVRIIDAYAAAHKRALDKLDPQAEYLTPAMRRADALLAMVQHHQQAALAPSNGGDRPRVVVALSYDTLAKAAVDAGLLPAHLVGSGEQVPAGVLRRWLCDADVLPVVLGGDSQPLDVGRSQRLVTPAIRAALELRDGGCVFPGCEQPPQACHAHHLRPWWAGGATSVANLVLACPHHHGIVEPGHDPTADRWQVRLTPAGVAEVIPPLRVDPRRRPRRHARFHDRAMDPPDRPRSLGDRLGAPDAGSPGEKVGASSAIDPPAP